MDEIPDISFDNRAEDHIYCTEEKAYAEPYRLTTLIMHTLTAEQLNVEFTMVTADAKAYLPSPLYRTTADHVAPRIRKF